MARRLTKVCATMIAIGLGTVLVGCASGSGNNESEKKDDSHATSTIDSSQLKDVLANPAAFEGDSLQIEGATFQQGETTDGKTTWYAYHDPYNLSEPFAFTVSDAYTVTVGEYVRVDGTVAGTTSAPAGAEAAAEEGSAGYEEAREAEGDIEAAQNADAAEQSAANPSRILFVDASSVEVLSAWDGMASSVPEATADHDIE